MSEPRRTLLLLAGGTGSRFGADTPKQMVMLAGKPILSHVVTNLSAYKMLDEIIVVAHASTTAEVQTVIDDEGDDRFRVVHGGSNRLESTRAGLDAVQGDEGHILIHDAVRPFLPHSVIDDCLKKLHEYDAIDTVIPSIDTVVRVT